MQKFFCFLYCLLPISMAAQDKVDFYSASGTKFAAKTIDRIKQAPADHLSLEIVFTVSPVAQKKYSGLRGVLTTPAGELAFAISRNIKLNASNTIRFNALNARVYVAVNGELYDIIGNNTGAFSISQPGYALAVTDTDGMAVNGLQAVCITAGMKTYQPEQTKLPLFNGSGNEQKISIYPNPAQNYLQVTANRFSNMVIMNTAGQILWQTVVPGSSFVNLALFPAGLYFIRLTSQDGTIHTKSFTKQ